jgi:endonuclease/exonuclease/phosphatase family metal-dependent hydrolase
MQRFTRSLSLVILSWTLLFRAGICQGSDLTIATFNCEFLTRPKVHIKFGAPFNINDAPADVKQAWSQPGYRDQKFKEAAGAVAQVIYNVGADVIALVEVGDQNDVEELRSEVGALGLVYPHMAVGISHDDVTRQHVAVFSKFPLQGALLEIPGRESYLSEEDDPESEENTGLSKGMRVTFQAYGVEFMLYVVHLASEKGGHEQDQQRIAQAAIVRRHYLPALKDEKKVIVAGDLNDHRGQPTLRRIRGFDDIEEDLIQTGHPEYFDKDKLDTRWTYEFEGIRQQIDHILLSNSVKEVTKKGGIKAHTLDHGNKLASDHRPLVVVLKLKD